MKWDEKIRWVINKCGGKTKKISQNLGMNNSIMEDRWEGIAEGRGKEGKKIITEW